MSKDCQLSFDFIADREHAYEDISVIIKKTAYENPNTGWKAVEFITDDTSESNIPEDPTSLHAPKKDSFIE